MSLQCISPIGNACLYPRHEHFPPPRNLHPTHPAQAYSLLTLPSKYLAQPYPPPPWYTPITTSQYLSTYPAPPLIHPLPTVSIWHQLTSIPHKQHPPGTISHLSHTNSTHPAPPHIHPPPTVPTWHHLTSISHQHYPLDTTSHPYLTNSTHLAPPHINPPPAVPTRHHIISIPHQQHTSTASHLLLP